MHVPPGILGSTKLNHKCKAWFNAVHLSSTQDAPKAFGLSNWKDGIAIYSSYLEEPVYRGRIKKISVSDI